MKRDYRSQSWLDSGLLVRDSPIDGQGVFAGTAIRAGQIVMIWGGTIFSAEDVAHGRVMLQTCVTLDEGVYLAKENGAKPGLDDFLNHSCDPNCWLIDEVTVEARRHIAVGEELAVDYATYACDDEAWRAPWLCNCRTPSCRRTITGLDWRLGILQEAYGQHFSPFILKRIARRSPR